MLIVVHVAAVRDAFAEISALGLSGAIGASGRRIAGLTRRELAGDKVIAPFRDIRRDSRRGSRRENGRGDQQRHRVQVYLERAGQTPALRPRS
jgi:hypothetical protein